MKCYEAARIKYIGPTAISKILHLFNPEIFVMWDKNIREKYGAKEEAKGYLDFLKSMQAEVKKVLEEKAKEKECNIKEVIEEICRELPSKKLGQKYRKTLAKLIDEYNWWLANHEDSDS